jgi:hypothetical protein
VNYIVPGLFGLILVEALASGTWWRPYFTNGLVVYREVVPLGHSGASVPGAEELSARFRGGLGPSLAFREIGPGEIAFRQVLFELKLFTYTPVMHGLIRLKPESQQVEINGRANWFSIAFCLVMAAFVWSTPEAWPILVFLALLLVVIGSLQVSLYRKVAFFIAEGDTVAESARPAVRSTYLPKILIAAILIAMVMWWVTN